MKIFIVDSYYPNFLLRFYRKYPEVQSLSFDKHRKLIFDQLFGTSDFYSRNLQKLGISAEEFIANDEILQKKWAKENKYSYFCEFLENIPVARIFWGREWEKKIFWAQIEKNKPEIVYFFDINFLSPNDLERIRKKGILLLGQTASSLPRPEITKSFDLIFTAIPSFVKTISSIGGRAKYFPLGFEAGILKKLTSTKAKYNVSFIGGFSRHHLKNSNFIEIFEYLAERTPTDFWGYGIKNLPPDSSIRKTYHGEAWGIDMYNILYNSKITINRHIDWAGKSAVNMRLYEATGVGSMLITDYKDNLNELFEIGKEVETYKSKEELVDKVKYYLQHDKERERIAKAGQKRTLRDHTYEKRLKDIISEIQKLR